MIDELSVKDERSDFPIFIHSELDDYGLTPVEFRVYGRLARRAGQKGLAYESVARMAKEFGVSVRTVQRVLKLLIACGLIKRNARPGKTDLYSLNSRKLWQDKEKLPATRAKLFPRREIRGSGATTEGVVVTPEHGAVVTPETYEGYPIEGNPLKDIPSPGSGYVNTKPGSGSVMRSNKNHKSHSREKTATGLPASPDLPNPGLGGEEIEPDPGFGYVLPDSDSGYSGSGSDNHSNNPGKGVSRPRPEPSYQVALDSVGLREDETGPDRSGADLLFAITCLRWKPPLTRERVTELLWQYSAKANERSPESGARYIESTLDRAEREVWQQPRYSPETCDTEALRLTSSEAYFPQASPSAFAQREHSDAVSFDLVAAIRAIGTETEGGIN
jgi:hypothetical protein